MYKYLILFVFCFPSLSMEEGNENPLKRTRDNEPSLNELPGGTKKRKIPAISEQTFNKVLKRIEGPALLRSECDALLEYVDDQAIEVDSYLDVLDQKEFSSSKSTTFSYSLYSESDVEETINQIKNNSDLVDFLPLIKDLIENVQNHKDQDIPLSHIAIRLDPDCRKMGRNLQRRTSMTWHTHGNTSYLFTLTRKNQLTTLVKKNGHNLHIATNRLFYMPGDVEHRTPENTAGKRIHVSIGIVDDF